MTGLERSLAAIAGEIPDRVPMYMPTIACDVSSKILGREVHTGSPTLFYAIAKAWMRGENAYRDFQSQIDEDTLEISRVLKLDVIRYGWRHNARPVKQLDEYTFLYGDPEGVYEIWAYEPRAMNYSMIETNAPALNPDDWPERAKAAQQNLPKAIEAARASIAVWPQAMQRRVGDEFLVLGTGGSFSVGLDEASLMACILEPGAVADMLDCQLEIALAGLEVSAAAGLKVVMGGGDMADNSGPMFSPEIFRELMVPRLKKFNDRAKELGVHYFWRSDGKLWLITDMLFNEAGVSGYGEVDFDASMTSRELRKRYPELVLWGNASAAKIHRGKAREVYDHALEVLEGAGPTRHFFGCSNAVMPGSPIENVEALFEAYWKYAKHPSRGA